ncbi:hypothetical protein RRG08_009709 [Elysia crispata]|uniref:Uncharacterized protein n=1 Tax=Elysia crispata TaxID=231223 RepID=A0AAE1DHZ8_9GAST|nr:hypothetical protein RRG08_009709 [Elysia crispata]
MALTLLPPISENSSAWPWSRTSTTTAILKSVPKLVIPRAPGISVKKLKKLRYCRQRSRRKEDLFHLPRLGSGFFLPSVSLDSAILTSYMSLLDSQNGRYAIGGDLPEIDDRSHSSDMGGSFKGGAMPKALAKHHQAAKPAWPAESGDVDKEYVGGVPVASVKAASGSEGSGSSTGAQSLSNVPVLPPIRHTLSPIRDVSRETTQPNILLPSVSKEGATSSGEVPAVHIQPATPQHSILTGGSEANATRGLVSRDAADALPDLAEEERETDTVADGGDRMSKKASVASIQSSEKDKGKSSSSDIAAQDQTAQQASTSVTGTSQTGKSRPSWKGGLRKGLTPSPDLPLSLLPTPTPLYVQAQLHEQPHKQQQQQKYQQSEQQHDDCILTSPQQLLTKLGEQDYKVGDNMPNVEKNQDQQQQISDSNQTLQVELNHQQEQLQPQQKTKHASTTTLSLGSGAPFLPRPPPLGISGMHGHAPLTHIPSQHDLDPDHPQSHKSSGPASSVASSWVFDKDGHERPRHGRLGKISKAGSQIESVRGSTIMAPDGEIISVGGSVARGGQGAVYDVGNINDVLMPHRHEGVGTDESGVSDDEPDEWKTAKKMSISLRSDRDSHKKQYKRGSATSGSSVSREDWDKLSAAGKGLLHTQTARLSEIDYTSGDIDATMSIYSWSYAPRENDLDPETGVIDHASSVRSLPSLRLDRGMIRDSGSGADGQHSGEGGANGSSRRSSDGENWARITERPEEEEVANIDSKEVTQEEIYIPQPPSPSPASERPKEQMAAEEEEREDGQRKGEDDRKSHSTPRSRSIALQTDSEVGSHRDITTAGRVDGTPRRSGNDADDEDEGEEEEAEGKWPGRSREKETPHLDTLREESATLQSSRRPSSVSKDDISRSESKNTPALGARSKAETAPVDGGVGSEPASAPGEDGKEGGSLPSKSPVKSSAASRKSLRKSGGEEGKGTAAESRKSSVAPSRASGAATGAGPGAKSAASSAKSKIKSGVTDKSGDRSVSSSATPGGRDIAQSAVSPTKSGKLDPSRSQSKKSVSGRSSKKSSAAKQRLDSQAGGKSRATTGGGKDQNEVEEEAALDNPWDDDDDDNLENDAGIDVDNDEEGDLGGRGSQALEDVDDFRNRSTPSEANARISGEDSGGRKRGGVGLDLAIQGEQLLTPPETPGIGRRKSGPDDGSRRSSVTEKDIMDTLTDHAQRIADSVLSQPNAGEDLENDVKKAAKVWAETHPPRPISRRASVREARAEAIAEILKNRRASSAAPSVAEYRNLIKKSLTEAAAKAAGIDPDSLSTEDAEISPDLLEALASQKLTPDQIEVVSDSSGRTRIQSRTDLQGAMGGVEEGHLYIAPAKKGEEAIGKRQTSIPADKVSVMDDMEFDRISYHGTDVASEKGEKRGKSKAGSKPGSIAGGTMADLSEMEGVIAAMEGKMEGDGEPPEPEDDFLKAVQQVAGEQAEAGPPSEPKLPGSGKTTPSAVTEKAPQSELGERSPPTLPPGGPQEMKPEDLQSQKSGKSGKTGVSQKSEASKDSKKKGKKTPEEKEEPFVVGKVDQKGELEKLYGPVDPPPPPPPPPKQEEAPAPAPTPPPTEPATAAEGKALSKQEAVIPPPPPKPEKEGKAAKKAAAEIKKTEAVAPAPDTSAATAAAGQDKGLMDHKDELAALYGSVGAAPPKAGSPKGKPKEKKAKKEPLPPKKEEKKPKKTKKGKKGKKKEEEVAPPPRDPTPPPLNKEVTPTPRKESTPVSSEPKPSSPEFKTDESDLEFNFVREQSSPEGDHPAQTTKLAIPPSPPLDEEEDEKSEEEDNNLKSISNREARAAKRAAAAAKRREEVERRRREKEELARKEKEEVERKVALQREMEEERRRREEERRLMKERQREQEERERREKSEVEKKKLAEAERERRQKEEYQRKLEEMKRKQQEEELRRHELMLQKQREEEERRLAEEEMMSQMAEQERLAYEEKKRLEEEERKRKELEEKLRRAEEAKKAMEEARRLAEEMARKQAELEARLKFNKALQEEASGLGHSQEINRAFVFSYFELLQWLGLDIPEFELAKLADY